MDSKINFERSPATNISILVVGGGIGGLCFAIEAYRKGHNVRVIERRPGLDDLGDIIVLQPASLRSPKRWPGFMERLAVFAYEPVLVWKVYDGTLLGKVQLGPEGDKALPINRNDFHAALFNYAIDIGILVEFNTAVQEYQESGIAGKVKLTDGRMLEADLVVAADGVGSTSWKLITGRKEEAISTGFAVYRVSFPAEPALKNPIIAKEFNGCKTYMGIHFGPDVHGVFGKNESTIWWTMTHKDSGNAEENWAQNAPVENALPYVRDWAPFYSELIKATPGGKAIDWKLMWRNPQPKMVSPQGRVAQMGDAAHAFLPTSGSGAAMAMEDGFTLAACLHIASQRGRHKGDIPLACRVYNLLRFERVACAQLQGFANRELLHKADFAALKKDSSKLPVEMKRWMGNHDPEQYAYDMYEAAANHLIDKTPFADTNYFPGYIYKPWTIQELISASERGEKIELEDAMADLQGEIVDLGAWVQWYAFDVIGEITFKQRFGFKEQRKDINNTIAGIETGLVYASLVGQIPSLHDYLLGSATVNYILTKLTGGAGNPMPTIDQQVKGSVHMTDNDCLGHLSANLLAGSDTTAISLRAVFYYLLKNNNSYRTLQKEIDDANTAGKLSPIITFSESLQLKYLQACLKEAMRMHPGVQFPLERVVPAGGATLCDVYLREGTIVGVNPGVVHRNTNIFGPDSDQFRPERWLNPDEEVVKMMERNILTFGAGVRTCTGKNIAIMEMGKLVPQIIRLFDIEWASNKPEWKVETYWFAKQSDLHVRMRFRTAL
ncbi:UbiH, 2-polyprenyl-6-methoxyphenol hydroxylase and related FAD-dependent oxidoreductase [Curvularia clavata]|uniref:UbiH, 2-polyprenyl-6-methoxyphenol hydroxylase and related FAD-dependent oxidoreductase n=1 Tax=Curvularia clavata TaxID=95742 RepID=A0A9Q9DV18_CURCL|nr:UbiH, 2-polyprenyl-6-methoxyphenol hydroxylase and related FAD-dependent oxidoreductase [Curvularia clavata]